MVMSSRPASHLLTFLLPGGARRDAGLIIDSPHGCIAQIGKIGLVSVFGPSREVVMDQAARILTVACRGLPQPLCVAATLYSLHRYGRQNDGRDWLELPGPADGWTIIVGAEVAFSPTALDPYL